MLQSPAPCRSGQRSRERENRDAWQKDFYSRMNGSGMKNRPHTTACKTQSVWAAHGKSLALQLGL